MLHLFFFFIRETTNALDVGRVASFGISVSSWTCATRSPGRAGEMRLGFATESGISFRFVAFFWVNYRFAGRDRFPYLRRTLPVQQKWTFSFCSIMEVVQDRLFSLRLGRFCVQASHKKRSIFHWRPLTEELGVPLKYALAIMAPFESAITWKWIEENCLTMEKRNEIEENWLSMTADDDERQVCTPRRTTCWATTTTTTSSARPSSCSTRRRRAACTGGRTPSPSGRRPPSTSAASPPWAGPAATSLSRSLLFLQPNNTDFALWMISLQVHVSLFVKIVSYVLLF